MNLEKSGMALLSRTIFSRLIRSCMTLNMSLKVPFLTEGFSTEVARKSVILVVRSHMRSHVAPLTENFPAYVTREGLFLRMHGPDVRLEISALSKTASTVMAGVVLLTSVYLDVSINVALLSK